MADYGPMAAARPTWIIVVRDLSHAVSIEDQPDTTACVVLDADTGLIRGVSVVPMLPEGFIADAAAPVDGLFEALTDLSAVEVRGNTATLTPLGAFGLHDWLEDEGYTVPIEQPGGATR